jgi:hypothetical protein
VKRWRACEVHSTEKCTASISAAGADERPTIRRDTNHDGLGVYINYWTPVGVYPRFGAELGG